MQQSSSAVENGLELLRTDAARAEGELKHAAVSADDARRSLDRLDSLERNKPTVGQLTRYGTIGGLGGAAIGGVGNAIEHGSVLRGATPKAKALNLAANAAKGALGGGAIPLLRMHSDRHAELGTLKKFMRQDGKTAAPNLDNKVGPAVVELAKQAGLLQRLPQAVRSLPAAVKSVALGTGERAMHMNEVAGLGVLAVPGLDTLQARARARMAGDKSPHGAEKRQLLGEGAHAALDVGGLGLLAAPAMAHLRKHAFSNSNYAGNVAQNAPGMKSHSQLPAFRPAELAVKVSKAQPLKRLGELVTGSKAGRLREAALRHADRAADGKLPRELKAARKLRGLAKAEEGSVGKVQGALVGSAALGAAADSTDFVEKALDRKKEAGVGVGSGFSTSQYSGPLSYGPFKMTSGIPPFRRQAMTKRDDSLEGAEWMYGENKEAAAALMRLFSKEAAPALGAMTPAAKLTSAQRVGGPKATGFSGPSIADIAKPKGFGKPMPGAQKNQI